MLYATCTNPSCPKYRQHRSKHTEEERRADSKFQQQALKDAPKETPPPAILVPDHISARTSKIKRNRL